MDLRINETLQTGAVRKPHLPFCRLVGTVSNCAYAVRLETAPTGGESVHSFLEVTIVIGFSLSERCIGIRRFLSVPRVFDLQENYSGS